MAKYIKVAKCEKCGGKGHYPNPEKTESVWDWNLYCECEKGQKLHYMESTGSNRMSGFKIFQHAKK